MKLYTLYHAQVLPLSRDEAWAFFSDPRNLAKITPPKLHLVAQSEVPEKTHEGLRIQYRIRPLPFLRSTWITEITVVRAPDLFVDEQKRGPYAYWQHQHHFRTVEGGTEVIDLVHYALPFGVLGWIVHKLIVRPQLEGIFRYRKRVLEERFAKSSL